MNVKLLSSPKVFKLTVKKYYFSFVLAFQNFDEILKMNVTALSCCNFFVKFIGKKQIFPWFILLDISFLLFIVHPYCTWQLQAKLERIYLKRLYAHRAAVHTQQMFRSSKFKIVQVKTYHLTFSVFNLDPIIGPKSPHSYWMTSMFRPIHTVML